MKKIYFVRHGATDGNENNKPQDDMATLSDTGRTQAKLVAERLKTIPIDIIITSDIVRAAETADVIDKTLDKKAHPTNLFREIQWPFVADENFTEIKKKADQALAYISALSEENVLVVTHGNFLILLIAVMMLGTTCTAQSYNKLQEFFIAKNTGITMIKENNGNYFLLTWNDHVHIG